MPTRLGYIDGLLDMPHYALYKQFERNFNPVFLYFCAIAFREVIRFLRYGVQMTLHTEAPSGECKPTRFTFFS